MINVMTAQVFYNLVENDEEVLRRSAIYRYNSTYRIKNPDVYIRNMNIAPDGYCSREEYIQFLQNNPAMRRLRLLMAYELYSNLDVIILIYPDDNVLHWLQIYLEMFLDMYGIVPHFVYTEEDYIDIPKDYDDFSLNGLYMFKTEKEEIEKYAMDMINESNISRQVAVKRLHRSEEIL